MMFVASLVVQPCRRIALFFFFRRIWAAVSLIIFNAGRKFLPGILGEVVQKSLAVQPYRKAVFHDLAFMFRDRQKMMIRIVNIIHFPTSFPFSFLLFYPPYSGLTTPLSFAAFWKIPVTGTHVCTVTNALIFHKNLTIFKCLNFQKFYAKTFDINMKLCYSWNRS